MSAASVIASVVVGVAFLIAGGAKIAAGASWPVQARGLGAPSFVIPFVPWTEIVVGALLCVRIAEPVPGTIALAMLIVFSALLALRLAQGQHPPCACFGSWSSKPLGWRHLARNGLLIAAAVVSFFG